MTHDPQDPLPGPRQQCLLSFQARDRPGPACIDHDASAAGGGAVRRSPFSIADIAARFGYRQPAGDHEPGAFAANTVGYLQWLAAQPEFGESWPRMRLGVDMLDHIPRVAHDRRFVDCNAAQRDMVQRRLVEVPHPGTQKFLVLLIRATLAGFLCPPSFGGKANGVGWTSIGFAPQRAACPTGRAM